MQQKNFIFSTTASLVITLFSTGYVFSVPLPSVGTVTNDNIEINADVSITGPVVVTVNDGSEYIVSLGGAPRLVSKGGTNGALYFRIGTVAGSALRFNVTDDLRFRGDEEAPLLLSIEGTGVAPSGSVIFDLYDGKKVVFDVDPTCSEGTCVLVKMNGNATAPLLEFTRKNRDSASDVEVVVERDSIMSFVATSPMHTGTIKFSPSNTGDGRMIFRVQNEGAFITDGHDFGSAQALNYSCTNVSFKTATGLPLTNVMTGTGTHTGLFVLNCNHKLSPLRVNPFLVDDYSPGDGVRKGFVLGARGTMRFDSGTYLDYVGLTLKATPTSKVALLLDQTISEIIKDRNPSAFIIDGTDGATLATDPRATIKLDGSSALYFRSGVDNECTKEEGATPIFSIDATKKTPGAGNTVLAVEGFFDIKGDDADTNAIEILSVPVNPTGGSVTIDSSETTFPKRVLPPSDSRRYNRAAFFINNRMILTNVSINHTDENHAVFEKDDVSSEPAYIGGESFQLKGDARPKITFCNSKLRLHDDAAFTGVDLFVPNC